MALKPSLGIPANGWIDLANCIRLLHTIDVLIGY